MQSGSSSFAMGAPRRREKKTRRNRDPDLIDIAGLSSYHNLANEKPNICSRQHQTTEHKPLYTADENCFRDIA